MAESLWGELERQRVDSLHGSLIGVADQNPDQRARLDQVSQKAGLPESVVATNVERFDAKSEVKELDLEQVEKDSPFLASYLRDRRNAAQAHDDVQNLSAIEKISRGFSRGLLVDDVGDLGYQQWLLYNPERQQEIDALNQQIESLMPGEHEDGFATDFLDPASEIAAMMLRGFSAATPEAIGGAAAGAGFALAAGQMGPQALAPEEVLTVPAGALTGFYGGMTIGMAEHAFRIETGHSLIEMLEVVGEDGQRIDPEVATYGAAAVGVINAALEVAGVTAVSAPFREALKRYTVDGVKQALSNPTTAKAVVNFAKRYAAGWAGEVGTEVVQEIVNMEAVELAKQLSDGDFEEMSEEEWNARVAQIFSHVGRGMALLALPGPSVTLAQDLRSVHRARTDAEQLGQMAEAIQNAKLRDRNPERFKELMRQLGENTGTDTVYVDLEAAEVLFQQGVDPDLQDLPGVQRMMTDAVKAREDGRSDVEVPIEVYATEIVGTSIDKVLRADMHMDPDAFTQNQLSQFDLEQRIEEIAGADSTIDESYVYNDIFGQLVQIEDRGNADQMARMVETMFQALAQRQGVQAAGETMQSLFDRFGLTVGREIDPQLQERMRSIDQLDVMLDNLRSGSLPSDADIFGDSMLQFIAKQGGIADVDGELAAMDVNEGRAGTNLIAREGGQQPDMMAEALQEVGYLQKRDINQMYDLIRDELAGNKTFIAGQENADLARHRASLTELDQILTESGIDLDTMTNEEVRQTFEGVEQSNRRLTQLQKRRDTIEQLKDCLRAA
jgi:hypothetical protein